MDYLQTQAVSNPSRQRPLFAYRTNAVWHIERQRRRRLPSSEDSLGSFPFGSVLPRTASCYMCFTLAKATCASRDARVKAKVRLAAPAARWGGFGTFGWISAGRRNDSDVRPWTPSWKSGEQTDIQLEEPTGGFRHKQADSDAATTSQPPGAP